MSKNTKNKDNQHIYMHTGTFQHSNHILYTSTQNLMQYVYFKILYVYIAQTHISVK